MTRARTAVLAGLALLLGLLAAPGPAPTWALFGDSSTVSTGSFAAATVPQPSALQCAIQPNGSALVSWSSPTVGTAARFRVRALNSSGTVLQERFITTNSTSFAPSLLVTGTYTVEVRTELLSTNWVSPVTTRTLVYSSLGTVITCE